LRVSRDGRLLLYEIKQGGERTGTFALLDICSGTTLPDALPRGYLRGFAFAPDGNGFYYVHEPTDSKRPFYRAAFRHVMGTVPDQDEAIFCAGEGENTRLCLISEGNRLGFLVCRFASKTRTDLYVRTLEKEGSTQTFVASADCILSPLLVSERILALTDRDAPNLRVVELRLGGRKETEWVEIVPESEARINQWLVIRDRIFVSYVRESGTQVCIFDFSGRKTGEVPLPQDQAFAFSAAPRRATSCSSKRNPSRNPSGFGGTARPPVRQQPGPKGSFPSTRRIAFIPKFPTHRKTTCKFPCTSSDGAMLWKAVATRQS
jgi:prolyl oligopeptidase